MLDKRLIMTGNSDALANNAPPVALLADYVRKADCARKMLTQDKKCQRLCLLDLPLDILEGIVQQVTHTNDLTALALTCSGFHTLVVPYIYARFDIVWPDFSPTTDQKAGVDALTYGLATLVMGLDVFGQAPRQREECAFSGQQENHHHDQRQSSRRQIRRGNNFAQYTRKFSLGNGPEDWVHEYHMSKESGKMLGTLVAIAVARMHNLESFYWDMPTGVLRDIWLALSSLADRNREQQNKLESVWVRWHDNRGISHALGDQATLAFGVPADSPSLRHRTLSPAFTIPQYPRVVFPTFSILPPLKSLSVLDIDELSYIEEMSILIERSLPRLRELRIGLAKHATKEPWARPSNGRLPQTSESTPAQGDIGVEGILASLFSRCHSTTDMNCKDLHVAQLTSESSKLSAQYVQTQNSAKGGIKVVTEATMEDESEELVQMADLFAAHGISDERSTRALDIPLHHISNTKASFTSTQISRISTRLSHEVEDDDSRSKLLLEVFELERIYLSKAILYESIDWTKLKSITMLSCQNTESFWRGLRKIYAPYSASRGSTSMMKSTAGPYTPSPSHASESLLKATEPCEFRMHLTKIHTDTVSPAFLAFIKDALPPDTIETLFLQQCASYLSTTTLEQIYKSAIRRHRNSLKRLMIDSNKKSESPLHATSWRRWSITRELLTCLTSNRMNLRELSISMDRDDWHYLLQRLPESPNLRSLHITHMGDFIHGRAECREAAQQIVDVVAIRPEVQLCFVAIHKKCFEILEISPSQIPSDKTYCRYNGIIHPTPAGIDDMLDERSAITDDEDVGIDPGFDAIPPDPDDLEGTSDNESNDSVDDRDLASSSDETDDEVFGAQARSSTFKLREILFYDDKIEIFKARHGRL